MENESVSRAAGAGEEEGSAWNTVGVLCGKCSDIKVFPNKEAKRRNTVSFEDAGGQEGCRFDQLSKKKKALLRKTSCFCICEEGI